MMVTGPALHAADQAAPLPGKGMKLDQKLDQAVTKPDQTLTKPDQAATKPGKAKKAEGKGEITTPVNINTADAAELEKLPGIGPATAKDIVSYRNTNGPFKSTEELQQVKGLKAKKYEAVKDKVTVK
jgi:competence protein ComEA